jgi:DNA-binding response OmpR family regulator
MKIIRDLRRIKKLGKVMIVDDELDIREMLVLMLQKEGFETETAEGGSDFLEKIDRFQPDLVILDVMMPGLTIEEIFKKLKEKNSKSKIILLTVIRFTDWKKEEMVKMNNIVEYIKKPFDYDYFVDVVKKHIGSIF